MSQGRDTFTLVKVATGTTLIRNTKYLKHAPTNENEEVMDTSDDEQSNGSSSSSDKANVESSETSHKHSDACMESAHSDDRASPIKAMSRLGQDV